MAKIDSPLQGAAGEHVGDLQNAGRLVLEEPLHRIRIDAGHRDEGADAVHDHAGNQERQTAANLGEA